MDRLAFHLLLYVLWLSAWANGIGVLVGYRVEPYRGEVSVCRHVVRLSVQTTVLDQAVKCQGRSHLTPIDTLICVHRGLITYRVARAPVTFEQHGNRFSLTHYPGA